MNLTADSVPVDWTSQPEHHEVKVPKLIRDKMPAIYAKNNDVAVIRIATREEIANLLMEKLEEELQEFREKPSSAEELADMLEVLHGLIHAHGWTFGKIESLRQQKRQARGGFEARLVLTAFEWGPKQ